MMLDLLNICFELDGSAHLMQIQSAIGWTMATRTIAAKALNREVGSWCKDPTQYALHSGRIGVTLS